MVPARSDQKYVFITYMINTHCTLLEVQLLCMLFTCFNVQLHR